MRGLKIILAAILTAVAVVLLGAAVLVLLNVMPGKKAEPTVLQTDAIFSEPLQVQTPQVQMPQQPPAEQPQPQQPPTETEQPAEPQQEPAADAVTQWLQCLSTEELAWQLIFTTPESLTDVAVVTRAGETTQKALASCPVGGLCYFSANLEDREQVETMLRQVQTYNRIPLFLAVDEEGGSVSRVGSNEALGTTKFASAAEYGSRADAEAVFAVGQTMAKELTALGFNVNFAPVADVITNPNNTEIGSRAYSSDPGTAAVMVEAMVQGLQDGQLLSCLKHFPGHGSTEQDSHLDRSVSNRTREELQQTEWIPFRSGIDAGAAFVMLSHLTNENISPLPSSLSPEVVDDLRQELGFEGIILTDSLQMGAITKHYTSAEAAVLALKAGADMLLMPQDPKAAAAGILQAVEQGVLTRQRLEESVERILLAKEKIGLLPPVR